MKGKEKEKVVFDEYGNVVELDQNVKVIILKKEYERAAGHDDDKRFKWAKGTVKFEKNDDGNWEYEAGGNWSKIDPDIVMHLNQWFLRDWFIQRINDEDFAEDEVEFVLKTRPRKIIVEMKGEAEEEELGEIDDLSILEWRKKIDTERKRGNYIRFKTKEGKNIRRYFEDL